MTLIKRTHLFYIISLIFLCSCNTKKNEHQDSIIIDVWYGDVQEFGQLGIPQRWINILGNVKAEKGIASFSYRLNAASPIALNIGSDTRRLALAGDFNIDIDRKLLHQGKNDLVIIAKDSVNSVVERKVQINFDGLKTWSLPYSINWSEVKKLQDVVQVVDGNWEITKEGLHNIDTFYDRVVAFGDETWKDYEVTTTVTFHSFNPPGRFTKGVSHAAIASRWPGHDADDKQPHTKWYPLGATSEFKLSAQLDSCRWRVFDGPKPNLPKFKVEQTNSEYRTIELNKKYGMKHRVQTIDEKTTRYSVKLWRADEPEPEQWDLIGTEQDENILSGSALLLAHHTNVTFGNVSVVSLDSLLNDLYPK